MWQAKLFFTMRAQLKVMQWSGSQGFLSFEFLAHKQCDLYLQLKNYLYSPQRYKPPASRRLRGRGGAYLSQGKPCQPWLQPNRYSQTKRSTTLCCSNELQYLGHATVQEPTYSLYFTPFTRRLKNGHFSCGEKRWFAIFHTQSVVSVSLFKGTLTTV